MYCALWLAATALGDVYFVSEPEESQDKPERDDESDPFSETPFDELSGRHREERNLEEREVRVAGVYVHADAATGVRGDFVLVRDNRERCVLIWVGQFEASAISMALQGLTGDRPLTHELLKNLAERLGGAIERVVIDDLWGETFYAKIWLRVNGKSLPVDSRPSDAIALALRAEAPLYMTEAVLEEASRPCEDLEGG